MQNIFLGLVILALVVALLIMLFGAPVGPGRFVDADRDGEPDETPEHKRRALEAAQADQDRDRDRA